MDLWSYAGKRVVIAGCFSGIGEAAARELVRLGAEVHGVDVRESAVPMASFRIVDLKEPAAIDKAVEEIGGQIDGLFNCAGLPQTFPALDVMKVNFLGMRHWTEQWIPRINRGGGVATIASNAAYRLQQRLAQTLELVATPDFASGLAWCEEHMGLVADGYTFSKEAIVVYTLKRAAELARQGVRLNVTLPSPVATPMMRDHFVKVAPKEVFDAFSEPVGRLSQPEEQAYPLLFLNSDAACFVSGLAMPVDFGFTGGVNTGVLDVQKLIAGARAG
ncbi:coniferyl-alcohol dehydrogenase [Phenylobacterium sp. LjRoot219]|uniref:coniferyl-alcohol dehydrogenase n=1 Tax=Phenylobacterium sp. LjRoot219 TaxID=3342283 RepID=UPI003ECEB60F